MRKQRALVGGEGNGGVIYPAVNFGRDSFIGMAIILEYMANSKKTVSQLLSSIKQYHIEKTKIEYAPQRISGALEVLKQRYKNEKVSTLDGVKIEWSDGWVHVRGSNTEPVIRIMAEAHDAQTVRKYIEDIKGQILC
jgi:phosphomannomutase